MTSCIEEASLPLISPSPGVSIAVARKRKTPTKLSSVKHAKRRPTNNNRHRAESPVAGNQWRPAPYDLLYTDEWEYELLNGKRNTIERSQTSTNTHIQPSSSCANDKSNNTRRLRSAGLWSWADQPSCPVSDTRGAFPIFFVKRTVKMHLPQFLSRSLWMRHNYSYEDIANTLQCFKPHHLLHLAIAERQALTKLAVQPSCETVHKFVYGAKAIVISHLETWLKFTYFPVPDARINGVVPNVLNTIETTSHVPPLPLHAIPSAEYRKYFEMLPEGKDPEQQYYRLLCAPFQWRGISIVPIELERHQYLLMSRVLTLHDYIETYGEPSCMTMQPILIVLAGDLYCVCEESFYFVAEKYGIEPEELKHQNS